MTTAPATDARPDSVRGGPVAAAFTLTGAACVVAGGVVAAVTGPLGLAKGSWLAAYLVLVCGVAAYAIGAAQGRFAGKAAGRAAARVQLAAWLLGNAAVIAGTLVQVPGVVDAGGVLLLAALGLALYAARGGTAMPRPADVAYRVLLAVVAVGAPVGMVLAHIRAAG